MQEWSNPYYAKLLILFFYSLHWLPRVRPSTYPVIPQARLSRFLSDVSWIILPPNDLLSQAWELRHRPTSYIFSPTSASNKSYFLFLSYHLLLTVSSNSLSFVTQLNNVKQLTNIKTTITYTETIYKTKTIPINHHYYQSTFTSFYFRSEKLWTQKLKSHLLRTQSLMVLPLKPGVSQYIAIHATLTARNFFLAYFYPSGPFTCIFFPKPPPILFLCWLWLTPVPV